MRKKNEILLTLNLTWNGILFSAFKENNSCKVYNYRTKVRFGLVGLRYLTPLSIIFQFIVVVSFIGGGNGVPRENHRSVTSN